LLQLSEPIKWGHNLLIYRTTGAKERIWESGKEKYYESVLALMSYHPKCEIQLNQLKLLISKESRSEVTQYYLSIWPDKRQVQITSYPHPYPQLASLQKEIIRYKREDGVGLTATLYMPPGYNPSKDGPLPCLIWSYPGEFKSREAAGQVRRSPNKFARISNNFPLFWLARGYYLTSFLSTFFAILFPIISKMYLIYLYAASYLTGLLFWLTRQSP
jgi:hypothetical protein